MATNEITITGNLAADPELKYLPNGRAVVKVRFGNTPRQMNRQTNEWEDGTTTWLTAEAWGNLAENIAKSLHKGNTIIANGSIKTEEFTVNGEQRTALKLVLNEIGVALSRHTVTGVERGVNRANTGGAEANASAARNYQAARPAVQPAMDDETPF